MCKKHFVLCLIFASWTIIQSALHLIFAIYSYYLKTCDETPSCASTIFFYLTYLYNKDCPVPILNHVNPGFLETYVLNFVKYMYSDNITIDLENVVEEMLDKLNYFPYESAALPRNSIFLLTFIILDGAWIVAAVALLMGICFGIKQSLSLIFYGPWLVMTACVSFFDAAAAIAFGLDLAETTNFSNWAKFVGIKETSEFEDLDAKNISMLIPIGPSIAMASISSRFVLVWITNWIGFFFVIKATVSVYKDSYKNQPRPHHIQPESPLSRSQLDLDSSAARIRNWQLFYGAIETTSSRSSQSERDPNSNRKDGGVEVQQEPEGRPSISTFYYAYSDVADGITGGSTGCLDELRGQLPWSYFPTVQEEQRRCQNQQQDKIEVQNRRTTRLRSDSSVSGTEL